MLCSFFFLMLVLFKIRVSPPLTRCTLICYSKCSCEPSGHMAWKIIHHRTTVNFLSACRWQAVSLMRCIPALKPARQIGPPASSVHCSQRPSPACPAGKPFQQPQPLYFISTAAAWCSLVLCEPPCIFYLHLCPFNFRGTNDLSKISQS